MKLEKNTNSKEFHPTMIDLEAYVNEDLAFEQKRFIDRHIEYCEMCSDTVEGLLLSKNDNLDFINDQLLDELATKKINSLWNPKQYYKIAASILLLIGFASLSYYFVNTTIKREEKNTLSDAFTPKKPQEEKSIQNTNPLQVAAESSPSEQLTHNKKAKDANIKQEPPSKKVPISSLPDREASNDIAQAQFESNEELAPAITGSSNLNKLDGEEQNHLTIAVDKSVGLESKKVEPSRQKAKDESDIAQVPTTALAEVAPSQIRSQALTRSSKSVPASGSATIENMKAEEDKNSIPKSETQKKLESLNDVMLKKIIQDSNNENRFEASWILANRLIELDKDESERLLKNLMKTENPFKNKAKKLLKDQF